MIEDRKLDHIKVCIKEGIETGVSTGFEDVVLLHRSLPEVDYDEIDLCTSFFDKKLKAPLVIAGMTGGHEKARKINENLAMAAEELGIAMGLGSQRAGIENPGLGRTYSIARKAAPEAFLIGNLGAVQFKLGYGLKEAKKAVGMIDADALALHMNPLQEVLQPEGDKNFKGCIEAMGVLKELDIPLIAKETGAGVSREDAMAIENAGFHGIDVGGVGGTSFAAVESFRKGADKNLARKFWNWGIPTVPSTVETALSTELTIISTGGVRDGVHVAKALALGASAAGMALPLLKEAVKSPEAVIDKINQIIKELKTAMFLSGASNIKELRRSRLIIKGGTREWLIERGINTSDFAKRG